MIGFSILLAAMLLTAAAPVSGLRFSTSYGSHMVLQQAPRQAVVWGYTNSRHSDTTAQQDCEITLTFKEKIYDASCEGDVWRVVLDPQEGGMTTYTITVKDATTEISMTDVLFGDVWVCSGQSNMAFLVENAFNGSQAVQDANNYPYIRLFTSKKTDEPHSIPEQPNIEEPWSVSSNVSISMDAKGSNDDNWLYFSATCFFYAKDLFEKLGGKTPLGLVNSNWGGTPIEFWSSPRALEKCPSSSSHLSKSSSSAATGTSSEPTKADTIQSRGMGDSGGWNGMIVPSLNMTIYGAIWYQGEANAHASQAYACQFPAMIEDWRRSWYEGTQGLTDPTFPFGFVQLAAQVDKTLEFPLLRYAQTVGHGYVPNPDMPNVFMAVAYDLGDPSSPYGSVHSRYKQDVGTRLAAAGFSVAYNQTSEPWTGPVVSSAAASGSVVTVTFNSDLELRTIDPALWEVCTNTTFCDESIIDGWIPAQDVSLGSSRSSVKVTFPSAVSPKTLRYAWRSFPCTFKNCTVYDSYGFPTPPFNISVTSGEL